MKLLREEPKFRYIGSSSSQQLHHNEQKTISATELTYLYQYYLQHELRCAVLLIQTVINHSSNKNKTKYNVSIPASVEIW